MLDTASFWMRLAVGLAAGAAVWLAAFGFGSLVRKAVPCKALRPGEAALLGGALGYAVVGSCVALLGAFHAISPFPLVAVIAVGIAALTASARSDVAALRSRRGTANTAGDRFAWFVTGCAWLTAAVAAALPTVDWDPLAYHLPIAAEALRTGTLGFDPGVAQSAFPLLAESAALPAFWLAGTAGVSFAALGAGIVLALLAGTAAERVRPGSGPLTCALVSSSSVWLWLAPSPYVDVPFAMFALAAFAIALCAPEIDAPTAAAAGLFAGLSAAVKYTGLITLCVTAALIVIRSGPRSRARAAASSLVASAVACAGWYVRAWALTGDPVYPFASARLGAAQAVREFSSRYVSMTRDWCGGQATGGDFLLLPWRLLAHPQMFCGDPGYALRLASVLVIAALFVRSGRPFALLTAALAAIWFWSSRQWRFLIPAIATYAIAASAGLDAFAESRRPAVQALLLCVALAGVSLSWLPRAGSDVSNSIAPAYPYIAGGRTGKEYLSGRLESYDAGAWALAHLRPGDRIAALDDVRNYYAGPAAIELNPYYQQQTAIDWSAPPAHRYDAVRARGASLMIVDENAAFLARTPTGVDWSVLAADERAGVLRRMFWEHDVVVYALPAAADRASP